MLISEHRFLNHFLWHLAFQVHHQFQHLVVALARKHNLASVRFKEGTSN